MTGSLTHQHGPTSAVTMTWRLLRVAGALLGVALVVGGGFLALNQVLLHGLAVNCSDGHPEYDPVYCGVTWTPGLPYVAASVIGLAVALLAVWHRTVTGVVLVVAGIAVALVALVLVAGWTWFPANPDHPEPVGPQLVLMVLALGAVWAGTRVLHPFTTPGG